MSKLRNRPQGSLKSKSIRPVSGEAYTLLRTSTGSALLDSFAKNTEPEAFTFHKTLVPSVALRSLQMPRSRPAPVRLSSLPATPVQKVSPSPRPAQANPLPQRATRLRDASKREGLRPASPSVLPAANPPAQLVPQAVAPTVAPAAAQAKQAIAAQMAQRVASVSPSTVSKQSEGAALRGLKAPNRPPVARPMPSPSSPSHQVKVYGGSSYKALQAKAAAGGLVNLDDTLLFGGADQDDSLTAQGSQSAQAIESDFMSYLGSSIEDYTASPIKGGLHYTAHIHEEAAAYSLPANSMSTVLGSDAFKLGDLNAEELTEPAESRVATLDSIDGETAELVDLSDQITQLNQRIEYLSQKLSELTSIEPFEAADGSASHLPASAASASGSFSNGASASGSSSGGRAINGRTASARRRMTYANARNPVVLDVKTIQLSESIQVMEKRVATLGPSFKVS